MDSIVKLLALLEKYGPLIQKYLPLLEAFLEKQTKPALPKVAEEPLVNPPVVPAPPAPAPAPIFAASQLNIMDVNGEEYNPLNAIGWGSYVRYDSNPKDETGAPLPAEELAQVGSIEWKSLWDGSPDTAGFHHVNVGGALYAKSNGYACSLKVFKEGEDAKRHKVFKEGEDAKRHTLDVWVTYHLKGGGTVDSNEVRVFVD
jgi:hypothetical protein